MVKYSKVAAKWWADKLRHIGPGNFNMGDSTPNGGAAMASGTRLALRFQPAEENIDCFEEILEKKIEEIVEEYGSAILSVDYGPDWILSKVAENANVSTHGFPWKTTMWISKKRVSVRSGYRAPTKVIYKA